MLAPKNIGNSFYMIEEILNRYESFSDSLISKICYERSNQNDGKIEVFIRCMNAYNDYQFESIKLVLTDVIEFRLIENNPFSALVVNSALLIKQDDFIIIDFFPDIFNEGLKLNSESDFMIRAKGINYQVLK
ncbi:hypothetical protein [Flavobacterium terrigena]|uniref:Immunity protein 50 n=2 Tax=Flavobacterium terrigena TaxID=402734 RepID=A0A1H6V4P2_9FLAO|nr:hypothetical protein [Flavobacterium terrigena]SEI99501.1 hypothetical protein SAMN05660918_2086 [Flavobacterium terrigena]